MNNSPMMLVSLFYLALLLSATLHVLQLPSWHIHLFVHQHSINVMRPLELAPMIHSDVSEHNSAGGKMSHLEREDGPEKNQKGRVPEFHSCFFMCSSFFLSKDKTRSYEYTVLTEFVFASCILNGRGNNYSTFSASFVSRAVLIGDPLKK